MLQEEIDSRGDADISGSFESDHATEEEVRRGSGHAMHTDDAINERIVWL